MTTQNEIKYSSIANRYTKALMEIAQEHNNCEKVFTDLELLIKTIADSAELSCFLEHPTISFNDKKQAVQEIFGQKIDKDVMNFLYLLIEQNRVTILPAVGKEYSLAVDKINNIARVKIICATEIDEELKNALQLKLENKFGKKIISEYVIDEKIIAGLIIQFGDNVIDASYASKFENMKKQLK